jgi:hypothetical protein
MPVSSHRHAAFETSGQISITDRSQDIDDLLLGDICHFHFVLRGHGFASPTRNMSPHVRQAFEIVLVRWITKVEHQDSTSVEILFLGDRPVATGLKMKKGLNVVEHGVVLVVRWVDD